MKVLISKIKKIKPFIYFLGIFIIFSGCEFEPEKIYHNNIEEPIAEMPLLELDINESVYTIYEETNFVYSLKLGKQKLLSIEFYLNNNLIHTNYTKDGNFTIDPPLGVNSLELVVYTTSGSQSIADQLNVEGFIYTKEWTIIGEIPSSIPVNISNISIENGTLKIVWEKYKSYRFYNYNLVKITPLGRNLLLQTKDIMDTTFYDSNYVGGSVSYHIDIWRTDHQKLNGDTARFITSPNSLILQVDSATNLTISWPKCQLETNFANYAVYNGTSAFGQEVYSTNDINDTSIKVPFGFYTERSFCVEYNSYSPSLTDGRSELVNSISLGTRRGDYFYSITQTKFPPYFVYTTDYKIDPFSMEQISYENPTKSGRVFSVMPNNKYLISGKYRLNTEDLSSVYKLKHFDEDYPSVSSAMVSTSLRNTAFFHTRYGTYIYDIENDSLINILIPSIRTKYYLSPNGKFYIAQNRSTDIIYINKFENGNFTTLASIYGNNTDYEFLCDSINSEFIMTVDNRIEKWSCDELKLLKSTITEATEITEIDPISNTFLATSYMKLYIYSVDDLKLLKTINVAEDFDIQQYASGNLVGYINSTIYLTDLNEGFYTFKVTL